MSGKAGRDIPAQAARPERRKYSRKRVRWGAKLETLAGTVDCRVLDFSPHGAKLELAASVAENEPVRLILPPLGEFAGAVVWQRAGLIGIRINQRRVTNTRSTMALLGAAAQQPKQRRL